MIARSKGGTIFGISAAVLLIVLDRFLKMTVESSTFTRYRIWWQYVAFERFHNPGIAFSLPIPLWIVIPLTVFFLIALAIWVRKLHNSLAYVALLLIFLGALSNAFDRVTYGYTIDYLRVIHAIINIADLMVVAGIVALLFITTPLKK